MHKLQELERMKDVGQFILRRVTASYQPVSR